MPGGWGRRAIGQSDHKLEDDELFKEIGGQLTSNNFDYSQWQRTGKKPPTVQRPSSLQHQSKRDSFPNFLDRPGTGNKILTLSILHIPVYIVLNYP